MDWTREKTSFFISLIKTRPVIWDTSLDVYKNKKIRHDALNEVAKVMGISEKEVGAKWCGLRGQYIRERRKFNEDTTCTVKWFAYKDMDAMVGKFFKQDSMKEGYIVGSIVPDAVDPIGTVTRTPRAVSSKSTNFSSQTRNMFTVYKGPVTPRVMCEPPAKETKDQKPDAEDSISSFAAYVAVQMRQFHPRLQIKAKYEINQLLFQFEMENHRYKSNSRSDRKASSSSESNPESPSTSKNYSNNLENAQEMSRISQDSIKVEDPVATGSDRDIYILELGENHSP